MNDAASAGLTYAGDAIPQSVALELLPDEARTRALLLDSVDAQQLVDFVRCTAFRRALLVREDSGAHATPWPSVLDPQAIRSLFVSSRLRAHDGARADVRQESFAEGAEGGWVVQVSDPTARRALHELARNAPRSLAFDELARRSVGPGAGDDAAVALATELFDVWLATGGLDLRADAPGFATEPGERPKACPLARWQAKNEGVVTSRLHHEVLFPDAVVRWILARLDGTRTIGELAREARTLDPTGASTDAELERVVAASIERLTACALMV